MKQQEKSTIVSYEPVSLGDWIIKVSKHAVNDGHTVVMIHKYKHNLRMGYLKDIEAANLFISNVIEGKNG